MKSLAPLLRSRDTPAFVLAAGMVLAVKTGLVASVPW